MSNQLVIEKLPKLKSIDYESISDLWKKERSDFNHQIVVLDDDPTGVQTVHGVSVYTDWTEQTIKQGFEEDTSIFFILTNSRALSEQDTEVLHRTIAERVSHVARTLNKPYLIISRGDSTLRGHYPLETEVMKDRIEESDKLLDGEVIIPFFKEGGRLTIDNVHYVQNDSVLIPAGETEFAKDRTFGFKSSDLTEWVEEKTAGEFKKEDVLTISLEDIRELRIDRMVEQLSGVTDFGKVVVNAVEEEDIKVFTIALMKAMKNGKRFIFRTAATFTKIIGDISSKPLLTREQLIAENATTGGLIVVGSHVQKSTDQLNALKELSQVHAIEFDCHLVLEAEAFKSEVKRVRKEAEAKVAEGTTVVIYTRRERLDLGDGMKEEELKLSVEISNAVTSIVRDFSIAPKYVIAKGGITSSDVGTNGLQVKRATVLGQAAPGIPVWETDEESKFPHLPYIIFPGNVGAVTTLRDIVQNIETV
ncbi:four-carbon acid sugar kinase family protein [Guptibacillus hwajinpoensis]|uniref:four-carbon acid sugar kinase family protein n=1 Tax=Guptibacillus hwajinpoensis TaxID=208199 RepID=UPI00188427E2|nr:four-carbon acid sugar kinase family protein [Pseudalkalibacillus hwajinpoensis]MBF0706065.1 hydroxyacid dehydrogenase [Pseudalkalibacillus hwajinpoensis]MCA0991942.1 hydroxyacid dehydrogenase [Pseudalkalibacillus hwajinpoensis]